VLLLVVTIVAMAPLVRRPSESARAKAAFVPPELETKTT